MGTRHSLRQSPTDLQCTAWHRLEAGRGGSASARTRMCVCRYVWMYIMHACICMCTHTPNGHSAVYIAPLQGPGRARLPGLRAHVFPSCFSGFPQLFVLSAGLSLAPEEAETIPRTRKECSAPSRTICGLGPLVLSTDCPWWTIPSCASRPLSSQALSLASFPGPATSLPASSPSPPPCAHRHGPQPGPADLVLGATVTTAGAAVPATRVCTTLVGVGLREEQCHCKDGAKNPGQTGNTEQSV